MKKKIGLLAAFALVAGLLAACDEAEVKTVDKQEETQSNNIEEKEDIAKDEEIAVDEVVIAEDEVVAEKEAVPNTVVKKETVPVVETPKVEAVKPIAPTEDKTVNSSSTTKEPVVTEPIFTEEQFQDKIFTFKETEYQGTKPFKEVQFIDDASFEVVLLNADGNTAENQDIVKFADQQLRTLYKQSAYYTDAEPIFMYLDREGKTIDLK